MGAYGSPELLPNQDKNSKKSKYNFIVCKKCGFSYSNYYKSCPNCGNNHKKHSIIGILSFVFTIFLLYPIGFIFSLIDIIFNKKNKHTLSVIALIISSLLLLLTFWILNSKNRKQSYYNNTSSNYDITHYYSTDRKFLINKTSDNFNINTTFSAIYLSNGTKNSSPKEENEFLICEFDIGNNTGYDLEINSLRNFVAYCDNYQYNASIISFDDHSQYYYIDGNLASGKRKKGMVVFEVPKNSQEIEIRYKPFVNSESAFIYTINFNK
ncbi:MAG: DUF4352 domain-containing protein [Clostridia bacterium]|nr:DUF4352 domain-containing protein [Clostridia bacterium]